MKHLMLVIQVILSLRDLMYYIDNILFTLNLIKLILDGAKETS